MYQAVVLAGGTGSRIYPLAEYQAKALLPIANRPLLHYPLRLLEKYGFKDVLVVTNLHQVETIEEYLHEEYGGGLQVSVVGVGSELDTADVLRAIQDRITSDFLLLSGDLISDVMLHHITDTHLTQDSFVTAFFFPTPSPLPSSSDQKGGEKGGEKGGSGGGGGLGGPDVEGGLVDFVGLDKEKKTLLFLASAADVDEEILLPKKLLKRHPQMTLTKGLRDSHCYVFSKQVFKVLQQRKNISSIKGELLPFLVRAQFSKSFSVDDEETSGDKSSPPSSPSSSSPKRKLVCSAFILGGGGLTARVTSLVSYRDANFLIATGGMTPLAPWDAPERNTEAYSRQVGQDCVIGAQSQIGEKSSVKKSVIGRGCQIGVGVKISNSILMNHVVVKDGASISNCIICSHAIIQPKVTLANSTVGDTRTVDADAKNEILLRAVIQREDD